MKAYLETHCSFTLSYLVQRLRLVTKPLFTRLAPLFICITTPVASGLAANPDPPRNIFIEPPPQKQYMEIDLGGINGLNINRSGQIVGNKDFSPGIAHAAYWASSQSAAIDLGTLPGFLSVAFGINSQREIVGYGYHADFSVEQPLYWASPHSAPVPLPGLPPGLLGEVYDINSSGQIVGQFFNQDFSVNPAVFYPNSEAAPIYLQELSDELYTSVATNINDAGNIFGDACDQAGDVCYAVSWANSASTPVALASPGHGFIYSFAVFPSHALNSAGNMVGYSYTPGFASTRATYWASSTSPAVILKTVGTFTNTVAAGISDNGQIVGYAYNDDFSESHAFLWPSATRQGIDLTVFFPAGSNWNLDQTYALAVNTHGEIVGGGYFKDGTQHGFALVPAHGQ